MLLDDILGGLSEKEKEELYEAINYINDATHPVYSKDVKLHMFIHFFLKIMTCRKISLLKLPVFLRNFNKQALFFEKFLNLTYYTYYTHIFMKRLTHCQASVWVFHHV